MINKYNVLIKDTLIFAIGNIGSKLILFFLVPFYTYYLTADDYGIADLVFTISQLMVPFVSLAISNSVLRYGLNEENNPEDVFFIGFIITLIGSTLLIFIMPIFNMYIAISRWKWYLYTYVVLSSFNILSTTYLKVENKNRQFALASIIQTLVLALTNIILIIYCGLKIEGFLLANVISVLSSIIFSCYVGEFFKNLNKAKYEKKLCLLMIVYSVPVIFNDVSWWIINSSNKIMIEMFIGACSLGGYAIAAKIPSLIGTLIAIFQQAWGISAFKEFDSTNDQTFYSRVFSLYTKSVILLVIVAIAFMKIFMSYYVASEFFYVWVYVPLLLVSTVFSAISSFFGVLYGALKMNLHSMYTTIIGGLVNVLLNYILIGYYGLWGAVFSTVISYIIIALIRMLDVLRYIKFSIDWRNLILNAVIVILFALVISMKFDSFIFSLLAIVAFIGLNYKDVLFFKQYVKRWGL